MRNFKIDEIKKTGNFWSAGEHKRVYFNRELILEAAGLEVGFYKTGNISWATLDEYKISNSQAGKIISTLPHKFYFDLVKNEFVADKENEISESLIEKFSKKFEEN